MAIYTTNTKINIDLLKSENTASEVLDTPEKPRTKGEIFHNRIIMVTWVIYLLAIQIVVSSIMSEAVFLLRTFISSMEENICVRLIIVLGSLLTLAELGGAWVIWHFIDKFSPRVKNEQLLDFNIKRVYWYMLAAPVFLMLFILSAVDMPTATFIMESYGYALYAIGLILLFSELVKITILTLIFPFIYKKEIREKEDGLSSYIRAMLTIWLFLISGSLIVFGLFDGYGQYFLDLGIECFMNPITSKDSSITISCDDLNNILF
ncbi:hypothetical protein NEAUS07_1134 [Nematocida ausubeli]|nr:hypothetical protein NEAUS07_1134 [Nematocida ausubeli]